MSQYRFGTVSVTTDSAVVTGVNTQWLANVAVGNLFSIQNENVWYEVASIESDTSLTLTTNYAGVTVEGLSYAIHRDFTGTQNYPYPTYGDINTGPLLQQTLFQVDAQLMALEDSYTVTYQKVIDGLGYTPANKAGDEFTGNVTIDGTLFVSGIVTFSQPFNATSADKFSTPRNISGVAFDGTENIELTTSEIDEGANQYFTTARARASVSVAANKGLSYDSVSGVVTGTPVTTALQGMMSAADKTKLDGLNLASINGDISLKEDKVNKGAANGYASLDESGKIPEIQIPAVAISDVYEVATQAAMLAIDAQRGDIAVRSDENKCYILKTLPATMLANWVMLKTPTDAVLSVAGLTGAISNSSLKIALALDQVQNGATVNATNAQLRDRATHTGTQPASTISDFAETVDDRVATLVVPDTNITVTYSDVSNTLTIGTTATINATDAQLRDRSTHTGTQTADTISDFEEAVNGVTAAGVTVNWENVQLKPDSILGYGITDAYTKDNVNQIFAPADSPNLIGTPTAPTPAADDNSTKLATTEYVQDALGDISGFSLEEFTAVDGQTEFTLTNGFTAVIVFVNGIRLDNADFSTNSPSFTLNDQCDADDTVAAFSTTVGVTGVDLPTVLIGERETEPTVYDDTRPVSEARVKQMTDTSPIGQVASFLGGCPAGWLEIPRYKTGINPATYPDFAAYLIAASAPWGYDENNYPYLLGIDDDGSGYGIFFRAWVNGGSRVLGSYEADAFQGHHHGLWGAYQNFTSGGADGFRQDASPLTERLNYDGTDIVRDPKADGVNGEPRVTDETRPKNVALRFCVKVFGTVENAGLIKVSGLASDLLSTISRVSDLETRTKRFTSDLYTVTLGGLIDITHNLGARPTVKAFQLVCQIADGGYSIGDTIEVKVSQDAVGTSNGYGMQPYYEAIDLNSTLHIRVGNSGISLGLNKTTGFQFNPVAANWKLRVVLEAE